MLSPLPGYEGLTAFFLESAFLGVLLFGRNLIPRGAHFVAARMAAAGTPFLLPVILVYTGWSYWVFRGKVRADIGYH